MNEIEFRELVNDALRHTTVEQLARALAVSTVTVQRWSSGQHCPHPLLRDAVREWLESLDPGFSADRLEADVLHHDAVGVERDRAPADLSPG